MIIVDIIGDCVDIVQEKLHMRINYVYGRQSQVLQKLQDIGDSITYKDGKYPILVLFQDFPERRGLGYYANLIIPKIVIMTLTKSTDYSDQRYKETFKPVLYPIYYEFLHQLSLHPFIVEYDENYIQHTKWDRVGTLPIGNDVHDFVDAIEISNLTITVSQFKTCTNGTQ